MLLEASGKKNVGMIGNNSWIKMKIMWASKNRFFLTSVMLALLLFGYFWLAEARVENEQASGTLDLQIPLVDTLEKRGAFLEELLGSKVHKSRDLRILYEKYIDIIGANGILETIQKERPKCHWEGHALGMVIYAKLGRIGPALQSCQDGCNSGCMHGVFMEAFKVQKQDQNLLDPFKETKAILPTFKEAIPSICYNEDVAKMYKPGDCAHGIGHAIMYILKYDISPSMNHCKIFDTHAMSYYCATGAYMEYVNQYDRRDNETKHIFYPCDTAAYTAACFRYKLVHVSRRHYAAGKKFNELPVKCMRLEGKYRLGCFHGIGNAHMGPIVFGEATFSEICSFGTVEDQYMCIEGAVERMGKFHPEKVSQKCRQLQNWRKDLCLNGAKRKMYSLDKPLELYVR